MRAFLHFLSGEVPGGVLLLFFVVLVINLALYYLYNSSKLFTKEVYKRKAIRANIYIFGVYLVLWIFLEPPKLPERIIILPFQTEESVDYQLAEAVQRQLYGNLGEDYILHRWEWIYATANKDSFSYQDYRTRLASKIGGASILGGNLTHTESGLKVDLIVYSGQSLDKISLDADNYWDAASKVIERLRRNVSIPGETTIQKEVMSDTYLQDFCEAKITLLREDFERAIAKYETPDSIQVELVTAAYLGKGILELEERPDSPLEGDGMNRNFARLYNLIIPYSKEGKDTADLNIILAKMYMHQGNYGMAEVCLERAVTQERYNSRIYYSMSFLHDSRYEELGFNNRAEILTLAVQLDPGYNSAVYELADELYTTGTAAPTNPNTIKSMEVLNDFLRLNPNSENILSLLGRILLQTKYTLEAMEIYQKLLLLDPQSAENHYNMGICYFHKRDYNSAKKEFNRALEINDYADAYLYLGAMSRLEGDPERALYYYRERIKRKQGDDDQYAKEAMRGIRLILNDLAEKEEKTNGIRNSQ